MELRGVRVAASSWTSLPVLLLPQFYQQVGTTAAFIGGLIGGVSAALMMKPRNAPLALANGTTTVH